MPTYLSADRFRVVVTVEGESSFKNILFSRFSGGDLDSEPSVVHPGGMSAAVVTGSRKTTADITVQKPFELGDMGRIWHIQDRVGSGTVTVSKQPVDANGHDTGHGFSYTGILKGINHPEHDADSTDSAMWGLVITPDNDTKLIGTD
jgi:hypothetical protein